MNRCSRLLDGWRGGSKSLSQEQKKYGRECRIEPRQCVPFWTDPESLRATNYA
jgi:hypothetical protein